MPDFFLRAQTGLARRARRPPDSQLSDVVADSQDESDNSAGGASESCAGAARVQRASCCRC